MKRMYWPIVITLLVLLASQCCNAAVKKAGNPPDFVPLGAYLSWERPYNIAKWRNVDFWTDVAQRLDLLAANSVDTLWVVNIEESDLPRLISECEKRKIKLLVSLASVEARVQKRWETPGYYDTVVKRVVKLAGNSKTLIGWVLSDEPTTADLPNIEKLRQMFEAADPNRFCLVVSIWQETPNVPKETRLPVVCSDLYPFFYRNDPNGPNTPEASRLFYRSNINAIIEAIGDKNAVPWVMAQCFSEIWGPRKYNDLGHLSGLPGAYLHWRSPTTAEMRWQVWDAVRSGCRGCVVYTLAPEEPNAANASLPAPDVAWKDVLAKSETDLGPNALTTPEATATPQLIELGKVYRALRPYKSLIRRWSSDTGQSAKTQNSLCTLGAFVDPKTKGRYIVVVNDDFEHRQSIEIELDSRTKRVFDVISNRSVQIVRDLNGAKRISLTLDAGAGTIIKLGASD